MRAVLKRLERENFSLSEYDDVIVRQIIEQVKVVDEDLIEIQFTGGMVVYQKLV